jgi:hypothetical protein
MGRDGRVLIFIHVVWILASLVDALLLVFSIPALIAMVHRPCSADCIPAQLSLSDFRALGGPGPALNAYVVYVLVTVVAVSLAWGAVGVVIAWRKWSDPMALFVSLVLITFVPVNITFGATPTIVFGATSRIHVPDILALSGPVITVLGIAATELIYPALAIFLLTFPTGRFAPRWSALLVLLWIAQNLLFFVQAPYAVIQLCIVTTFGSAAAIQIYRYVQLYTPVQRQQTKWVVFPSVLTALPLFIGYNVAPVFWPALSSPGSVYRLANIAVLLVSNTFVPLGIGVAVLRYRLYDIDVIIRRSLIYGSLTVLLAALYFGSVIVLQLLVRAVPGQGQQAEHNPIVLVLSTLLIAALFMPLRRRVQMIIDRRFYRTKFDATRTVEAFATTLQSEVDLDALREHLVEVVQETMQPVSVSLWLAPASRRRTTEV